MSAMECQIKRCEEPIEYLLRLFFKQKNLCTKERYTLALIMHHFLELCNPATGICTHFLILYRTFCYIHYILNRVKDFAKII